MDEIKCKQVGLLSGGKWDKCHDIGRRVYDPNGLSPAMHTCSGGNLEPKIIIPENTKKGYDVATCGDSINTAFPNSKTRRGRVGHGVAQTLTTENAQQVIVESIDYRFYQQAIETLHENDCDVGDTIDAYNRRVNKDGISPTITTRPDGFKTAILPVVASDEECIAWDNELGCCVDKTTGEMLDVLSERPNAKRPKYRIRKLTPGECFRLMGVKKSDYDAVSKQQSDSSQYHLAGDSIVTACLMAIFGALLSIDYNTKINELVKELMQ